ncbi:hypothetical protein GGS20DRAFT_553022 [Poronia punctata]|nr:hypothetical protein GGS20DRAFT_553022 [Poronia punctata]
MHFSSIATVAVLAMLQPALASWQVTTYETSCPSPDDLTPPSTGGTAGSGTDEIWCNPVSPSHSIFNNNIEGENMEITLFSDVGCNYVVKDRITTNGCKVIPKDTVIEAIRILPRR